MKKVAELGLELIELEDQVLLVDKKLPVFTDDWALELYNGDSKATTSKWIDDKNNVWWLRKMNMNCLSNDPECIKVLTSTKQLEGLPLLVIENEVDEFAYEHCDTVIPKDVTRSLHYSFKCGYNKSQERYSFSEEDMLEFSEWKDYNFYQHIEDNLYRTMQARPMYKVLENKYYTLKELLQIWKEQKNITLYYE